MALLHAFQVTHLYMTPSLFDVVVSCDLPSLVCVILAGERVPQHQLEIWRDKVKHCFIAYGNTETVWATTMDFSNCAKCPSSNIIGFPLPHISCYVLDKYQQLVPVGVIGELCIGGDGVGRGYLNRPNITRKAFIKNPFSSDDRNRIYKTGDMVKLLPDGSIFYIGRNDGQVKIRGQRVELGEVEMALRSVNSYITRAVVLVHEQNLVAFVTPGSVGGSAVKTGVSKVLPPYMVPSVVLSMDSIPTTLSGKADHHTLLSLLVESKAAYISGGIYSSHEEHMVPNSPLEEAVLAIYRKELQSEGMGMASDFIESGGDSLKAVRIVSYLRALYEERPELLIGKGFSMLSATDILQHHTPRTLLQACLGSTSTIEPLTQGMSIMPRPTEMNLRAPASFQQTTMYTGDHLAASQAHSDYNSLIQLGAIGKLDVEALKMALAFLWRRHQVLRTGLILQVP
ncbi:MAG: AMP-binding protein [Gammaproteobacteria bacterium]|nr:AMP-binding protein [Gammaproteobacteria bacterium]